MESDPLAHAWQMYWSHRLHGTTNDYKAFEDTVRPLLQQVEGERDALAGELAEVKARCERLRGACIDAWHGLEPLDRKSFVPVVRKVRDSLERAISANTPPLTAADWAAIAAEEDALYQSSESAEPDAENDDSYIPDDQVTQFKLIKPDNLAALVSERDALAGENDRLWRFLADEAPIRELPEWMRDRIVERIRAEAGE